MFTFEPLKTAGAWLIEPQLFGDSRGYFMEVWRRDDWQKAGIKVDFVQDNESFSTRGVLRGLHYQLPPFSQAKLVRVVSGCIVDVIVDIRRGSPSFGCFDMVELSGDNRRQLFMPRGVAHGFLVLSDTATFAYKCDNFYSPESERCIRFDDPELNIPWPTAGMEVKLSVKDLGGAAFREAQLP